MAPQIRVLQKQISSSLLSQSQMDVSLMQGNITKVSSYFNHKNYNHLLSTWYVPATACRGVYVHDENARRKAHTAIGIYKTAAASFPVKNYKYEKGGILISNFYNFFFLSMICLDAHHAEILILKQKMK